MNPIDLDQLHRDWRLWTGRKVSGEGIPERVRQARLAEARVADALPALMAEVGRLRDREAALIRAKDADLDDLRDCIEELNAAVAAARAEADTLRAANAMLVSALERTRAELAEFERVSIESSAIFARMLKRAQHARAEADTLRAALEDIADHGLRADLMPTMNCADTGTLYRGFADYLRRLDGSVRERARRALGGALFEGIR